MTELITIPQEDLNWNNALIRKILTHARIVEALSNEPSRVYFAGGRRENPTVFERRSWNRELGASSNDSITGFCLLRLVRTIIDKTPDLIRKDALEFISIAKKASLDKFITYLANKEMNYSCSKPEDKVSLQVEV